MVGSWAFARKPGTTTRLSTTTAQKWKKALQMRSLPRQALSQLGVAATAESRRVQFQFFNPGAKDLSEAESTPRRGYLLGSFRRENLAVSQFGKAIWLFFNYSSD